MCTIDDLFEDGNDDIKSNFPSGSLQYWPEALIQKLVYDKSVRIALTKAGENYDQELADYILQHAKRLFAMVAATEADPKWRVDAMRFFKENGFADNKLSVEVGGACLIKESLVNLGRQLWSRGRAHRISETQWKVLVPVISTEKDNYDFNDKAILPFNKIRQVDGGGGFSAVSEVSIQEGHFTDSRLVRYQTLRPSLRIRTCRTLSPC